MITNFWNAVELYCGHHEEPIDMQLNMKGNAISYVCTAADCTCSIPLKDYEKMLDYFSKLIFDAEVKDEKLYLTGYKWENKKYKYEVIEHSDKIKIKMFSKEILRKG